ncbi:hypothetical protein HUE56_23725 (plasmid) [Azospirillum oryzae]|uniref:Response regulatory domain-containing protein n=1 Tax=Azospirillum oryzae TaxID=286727 RepID=A0A6N1AP65_9PROT|nr:response regulator [Azospirillum oryzae]KAA0586426.1 response regulator [Azospirillum oryzae]QKS53511.1 hypothetical protein HUE56_23725 [Azospirillum oryzae]
MGIANNICRKPCNFKSTSALIVDFNISSSELMERTLTGLKLKHIYRSFSTEDALSLLSENEIGIVIVNADTIREKALQLLEMIRFRQTKDPCLEEKIKHISIIPFVIISSAVTPKMAEKVADAGICALVSMPFKPIEFMKKIKNLLYVHCEDNCFNMASPSLEGSDLLEEPGSPR